MPVAGWEGHRVLIRPRMSMAGADGGIAAAGDLDVTRYDGYTYREVSEVRETPIGTVKTRMRDGLHRLRECPGVQP